MVKGCETGDFGDRWLKHSKQWLGARWAGLSLGESTDAP